MAVHHHVVYEEGGDLKTGSILSESETSLQVEAPHGKRSKIKRAHVLLEFDQPAPLVLMADAQRLQVSIDLELLWSSCQPETEWHFSQLAREYQGHEPSVVEQVAFLLALQNSPIYFNRRQRGMFRPAAETNLRAALAGLERRRQQEQQKAEALEQLANGYCPEWLSRELPALLYRPDKNSWPYKTLEAAAEGQKISSAQLLARCGVLQGSRAWHEGRFEFDHFGPWKAETCFELAKSQEWPSYTQPVFSIDDATTTEIDDAFSLRELDADHWEVGVHIAAPALVIEPDGELAHQVRQRLSTVYMPGRKISMLPDSVIAACSLDVGTQKPALSLLLTCRKDDLSVVERHSKIQRVKVGANLRLHELETWFNREGQDTGQPYGQELSVLWKLSQQLAQQRGVNERAVPQYQDYTFTIEGEHIDIGVRARGAPLDELVSELMIEVNRYWATELVTAGYPSLYRIQGQGRTGTSVEPGPHVGLGLDHYAWCSSPLRRAIDLVNQWQLVQQFQQLPPRLADIGVLAGIAQAFDQAYEVYQEFQRHMERYWCLRWLEQEQVLTCSAVVVREGLVRLEGLPLVLRVRGVEASVGTEIRLKVRHLDLWTVEADCELVSS